MRNNRGEMWVIVQIILLAAIALSPTTFDGSAALVIIGLLIGLVGTVMVGLSILNLRSSLSIFPRPVENGSLSQGGLYSIVRHPIYAGVILGAFGWSLLRASLPALVLTLILVVFFDRKAHREEQWLTEKYPEYQQYRQRVHKLIPWIY